MVCKICGKDLTAFDDPETRSIIDDYKERMKDLSCEELYKEYFTASVYHLHMAAKELLIERGHNEVEGVT